MINHTGKEAYLSTWLDFNANGLFEDDERIVHKLPASETEPTLTMDWSEASDPGGSDPGGRLAGTARELPNYTFVRIRLTTDLSASSSATGEAPDGEVEDYFYDFTVMPVNLISFHAVRSENGIKLKWQTASEENFSHFEIERGDRNLNFTSLGQQVGSSRHYTFTDSSPLAGVNYYRLKMIDQDGTFTYSRLEQVTVPHDALFVFPNPVGDQLNIQGVSQEDLQSVEIVDGAGKIVYRQDQIRSTQFHLPALNAGTYLVKLTLRSGQTTTKKIMIGK